MAFAIELYFDDAAEAKIRSTWAALSAASLPAWPQRIGARPHISILVVDNASPVVIDTVFRSLFVAATFQVTFDCADAFGVDDAIILLKPEASAQLRSLHDLAASEARSHGLIPRHEGDEWVPHCTCDYAVGNAQLSNGLAILNQLLPLQARVQEIGYVEVTPESVKQIATRVIPLAARGGSQPDN